MSTYAPHVLQSLRARVFPSFRIPVRENPERVFSANDRGFRELLLNWAREWNLDAPWILEAAIATMRRWTYERESVERWSVPSQPARFHFTEQEEAAFVRVRKRHESSAAFDAMAQERGLVRLHAKHSGEVYRWFVQRQVLRMNWRGIARPIGAEPVELSAVIEAVQRLAKDVGISLRKGRAGRPPSLKN